LGVILSFSIIRRNLFKRSFSKTLDTVGKRLSQILMVLEIWFDVSNTAPLFIQIRIATLATKMEFKLMCVGDLSFK
jgi:hypothetical protein